MTSSKAKLPMNRRILMVATDDRWFIAQHLKMARAAVKRGHQVHVAVRNGPAIAHLHAEPGLDVHAIPIRRGLGSLRQELASVLHLRRLYRELRPDIIHHLGMKALALGGLAATGLRTSLFVNSITGLGYVFTSTDLRAWLLNRLARLVLPGMLGKAGCRVVLENPDDLDELVRCRILRPGRASIIPCGVDDTLFTPLPDPPPHPVTVAYVGRMLRDKGVEDIAAAMRILHAEGVTLRLLLVGTPDPENPSSIDDATLRHWEKEGLLEFRGFSTDIVGIWRQAHAALLPSYREGLPVSLLEAAACARPAIATDVPGCRTAVLDGRTGILVPPGDPEALAAALKAIVADHGKRRRMGLAARRLVEREFSGRLVTQKMLALYDELASKADERDRKEAHA